jgi:hypothetical protein
MTEPREAKQNCNEQLNKEKKKGHDRKTEQGKKDRNDNNTKIRKRQTKDRRGERHWRERRLIPHFSRTVDFSQIGVSVKHCVHEVRCPVITS